MKGSAEITDLLRVWSDGDVSALEHLIPLVFDDLRRIARRYLRNEERWHTLEPTALVHEVYLKLVDQREPQWQNREHFFAIASRIMRRILVDYAKARRTTKRGKAVAKVPLEEALGMSHDPGTDYVVLYDALERLAELDPRQARAVELSYFFGFEHKEIAEILSISETTSKRELRMAKLWLYRELARE